MNQPEHRVARRHVLRNHAQGEEIVDLVEGHLGALNLLIDGVEPLDAPLHARVDVVLAQLLADHVFNAAQELLAFDAARFHGRRHLLVADGIGIAEGQILEFAAHLAHPQPMRQRRVDVHGLAGDRFLAIGLQMLEGAHVVQAVGQLDEHHAHVGHHGQQHFAHVLGLAVFAIGELDLVDLGHALDDMRHLVAEVGGDLLVGGRRVLDRIVQQAGGDGRRVELHLRQHFGHFQRMDDVRLARGAHLAGMMLHAELPCFAYERNVLAGAVGLHLPQQLLDAIIDHLLSNLGLYGNGIMKIRGGRQAIRRGGFGDRNFTRRVLQDTDFVSR